MHFKSNPSESIRLRTKLLAAALLLLALAAAGGFILSRTGHKGRPFPDPKRSIRLVVPFAQDGKTDIMFRRLADNMQKNGVNIEVLNVTGNGGVAGIEFVLEAEPDGYTLLASTAATITATLAGQTEGYRKLQTVAGLNIDPFMLVTKKNRFKDFQDLLDYAASNEIAIVTAGKGSLGYRIAEKLTEKLGPGFKNGILETDGGTGEMDAVQSGLADVGIITQFEALSNPYMEPLVILTGGHSQETLFLDIPTIREQGIELDIPCAAFCSIMVRNDVPQNVVVQLESLVEAAYYTEDFQQFQESHALIKLFLPLGDGDNFLQDYAQLYAK